MRRDRIAAAGNRSAALDPAFEQRVKFDVSLLQRSAVERHIAGDGLSAQRVIAAAAGEESQRDNSAQQQQAQMGATHASLQQDRRNSLVRTPRDAKNNLPETDIPTSRHLPSRPRWLHPRLPHRPPPHLGHRQKRALGPEGLEVAAKLTRRVSEGPRGAGIPPATGALLEKTPAQCA